MVLQKSIPIVIVWSAGSTLVGVFLGYQIVYKQIVVPKLEGFVSIPLYFWTAMIAPPGIVWTMTGVLVKSLRHAFLSAGVSALVIQIFIFVSALLGQPGMTQSLAIEAPYLFWFQSAPFALAMTTTFISIGMLARKCLSKVVHKKFLQDWST